MIHLWPTESSKVEVIQAKGGDIDKARMQYSSLAY